MALRHGLLALGLAALVGMILAGCGGSSTGDAKPAADSGAKPKRTVAPAPVADSETDGATDAEPSEKRPAKRRAKPLQLGGGAAAPTAAGGTAARSPDETVARLQPFQVLLGRWRWVTQKKFGDFPKSGEDVQWIWDFRTKAGQPALQARSQTSPYYRELRLTTSDNDEFELQVSTPDGPPRILRGGWQEGHEPKETPDGKILQRTFKLQLAQIDPMDGQQWQMTLNLLDNDQYLMELKKRGTGGGSLQQLDTVRQQREGTSFAVAESDNPGPKCIVSGGLGTMSVSYQGKTYPVCCTGCSAAFNEDPERWLAKLKDKSAKDGK
ncbi:MAG: hypothetical protein NT069_14320 [Planctomycetota bacterium]|nr:hypothetical protein [Planctomycetota bacterium]